MEPPQGEERRKEKEREEEERKRGHALFCVGVTPINMA
jgi:hypothetical protein